MLDGYDEISERRNLYRQNHWSDARYDIQAVTFCRPEALQGENRLRLFEAPVREGRSHYEALFLQRFTPEQMAGYLQKFCEHLPESLREQRAAQPELGDWQFYWGWLERIAALKDIATTPFLLSIVAQALPTIVQRYASTTRSAAVTTATEDSFDDEDSDWAGVLPGLFAEASVTTPDVTAETIRLTCNEVFDAFVDHWFGYQAERLHRNGKLRALDHASLVGYLKAYAQNLAARRLRGDGRLDERLLTDRETLDPVLTEPWQAADLLVNYYRQDDRGNDIGHSVLFVSEESNLIALRSGCLLRTQGGRFQFLHKSLVEYFAARDMFLGLQGEFESYLHGERMLVGTPGAEAMRSERVDFWRTLIQEPAVLSRLAERVTASDERFRGLLGDIVMASKERSGLGIAAANAMTVLNRAGVSFSGVDCRDVQIAGADMRSANCFGADFRGADLSRTHWEGALLMEARWRGSCVEGLEFGEQAYVQYQAGVTAIAAYPQPDGRCDWLVGCEDGYVYQQREGSAQPIRTFRHRGWFDSSTKVTALAVDSERQRLATAGDDRGIVLWDVGDGRCLRTLTGHTESVKGVLWIEGVARIEDDDASQPSFRYELRQYTTVGEQAGQCMTGEVIASADSDDLASMVRFTVTPNVRSKHDAMKALLAGYHKDYKMQSFGVTMEEARRLIDVLQHAEAAPRSSSSASDSLSRASASFASTNAIASWTTALSEAGMTLGADHWLVPEAVDSRRFDIQVVSPSTMPRV